MSIRKRTWTNGGGGVETRWVVDVMDANGHRERRQFESRKEADAFHTSTKSAMRAGSFRGDAGKITVKDAAELFRPRMHVHQLHLWLGDVEQRVALRRHFAHATADQQHEVGALDARQQLRVGSDAAVARVARVQRVEEVLAAEFMASAERNGLLKNIDRLVVGGSLSYAAQRRPP